MLSGYKTYITAAIALMLGAASLVGILPAGVNADPTTMFTLGIGLIFSALHPANVAGK